MPVVSIINRNIFKTVVSARCLSWYSNYLPNSGKHTVNREQNLLKTLPVATNSTSFQCRFKYDKSSNRKDVDEVGTLNTTQAGE